MSEFEEASVDKGFRGGKNFRQGEDRVKNFKEKLFWNQHDKTNTKSVVEV